MITYKNLTQDQNGTVLKVSAIALSMFIVSSCSEDNVFFNVCDEDVAGSSNTSMLLTRSSFSGITSLDIDTDVNADGVLVVPADAHYMIYSGSNKPTDHRIVIEDGGMVTLAGVNITAIPRDNYNNFSGITCEGNARIYLADNTENKIKGGGSGSAGIEAGPIETTLTIKGITGKLESFGGDGAGIGSGFYGTCGMITIDNSMVTSHSVYAAGIGSGGYGKNQDIIINSGTIIASSDECGAAIGSAPQGYCYAITIKSAVTSVTATKGDSSPNSIGAGYEGGSCHVYIEDPSKVTMK